MTRIPLSTYRIQFNPGFDFKRAIEIVEYLSRLGISDVYASPIFKARKGSPHGYDIVDMNQLNPDLGNRQGFEALTTSLRNRGMGWIQDIVPNHMAVSSENRLLMDVLEKGSCSDYFDFFDIEWNHPYETIKGRLLAPFLGRLYGEALEEGEIRLGYGPQGFFIKYFDLELPLTIESYARIITDGTNSLKGRLGEGHPDYIKFSGTCHSLKNFSSSTERCAERHEQILFVKRMLWELCLQNREIKEFIDGTIAAYNGKRGVPQSFNLLDGLLAEQKFRLSFWKVAAEEINYRRFFNINDLISLRMEEAGVFERFHSLLFDFLKDQTFTGLRIDHIDGLYDPTDYLKRLREEAGEDSYIVVEKILFSGEMLPEFWPVEGTTGYDFLNAVNGIFCQRKNEKLFDKIYSSFTGFRTAYEEVLYEKRKLIAEKYMIGDADNIAHSFKRILSKDRHGSDMTIYGLKRAFIEIIALFPVYRTYISHGLFRTSDPSFIQEAAQKARMRNPSLLQEINFIEKVLLLQFGDYLSEKDQEEWLHFVMRFQQFTGPNMAKGLEDTALYVYNRLLSLNEVGGNPGEFGISLEAFHNGNQVRAANCSCSMNATSTHDTKRGEDVRARINVLSEIPIEWMKNLVTWSKMNRKKKKRVGSKEVPERNDEYSLYQTLLGVFPFHENEYSVFLDRVKGSVVKSIREAKVHTAWLKPDTAYEDAFVSFVEDILAVPEENEFLKLFIPFQKKVAFYGMFNSLSQTLLKMTSPGIPDFYQGSELWDLNLVDPDNRRPVDYERRKVLLSDLTNRSQEDILGLISDLLFSWEDGRIKLFLILRALKARRERERLFQKGDYLPLAVRGRFEDHFVAFARRREDTWAITLCPRFLTDMIQEGEFPLGPQVWGDTRVLIPEEYPSSWKEVITGKDVETGPAMGVGDILRDCPVALLISS